MGDDITWEDLIIGCPWRFKTYFQGDEKYSCKSGGPCESRNRGSYYHALVQRLIAINEIMEDGPRKEDVRKRCARELAEIIQDKIVEEIIHGDIQADSGS